MLGRALSAVTHSAIPTPARIARYGVFLRHHHRHSAEQEGRGGGEERSCIQWSISPELQRLLFSRHRSAFVSVFRARNKAKKQVEWIWEKNKCDGREELRNKSRSYNSLVTAPTHARAFISDESAACCAHEQG
ncbi:hypothetical protein ABZP36_000337 [Zizania latifolia]